MIVLPFENKTNNNAEYNWIGESFALMLSEVLMAAGARVIEPEVRRLIYEKLQFPETTVLTRASALRIAETAGARLLVIGSYEVSGAKGQERINALARVIDVEEGRVVGNQINIGAPLKELLELQASLGWEILFQHNQTVHVSRMELTRKATAIPLAAFAAYVKARMVNDPKTKVQLLTLALSEHKRSKSSSDFTAATFELGRVYFQVADYREAIKWLKQIKPDSPFHLEALFFLGLCYDHTGDLDGALSAYEQLSELLPVADVYNNLAALELKKSQLGQALTHFSKAVGLSAEDADLRFNYGYAFWLSNDFENAVIQLRQAVRRRSADGEAQYLLAKSLARLGRTEEAQGPLSQARRYLTKFSEWEKMEKLPVRVRLKTKFHRAVFSDVARSQPSLSLIPPAARDHVRALLTEAETLAASHREDEALQVLAQLLKIAPEEAEAHWLKGRIYERRGELRKAVDSLRAASFWNPQLISAHILLGRIYLSLGDTEQAKGCIAQALRLDPTNQEALEMQKKLESVGRKP